MKTYPKIDPQRVRNLVFDLGGVLYQIDVERSVEAFRALIPASQLKEGMDRNRLLIGPLVQELETGRMKPADFLLAVRKKFQITAPVEAVKDAWMQILEGVMPGRVELLRKWKPKYRLFLLSNTNPIHFEQLRTQCAELFAEFEQCHLSFEMGMRKPDREIFDQVVTAHQLDPGACLFFDDSLDNVDGARAAGWQALQFKPEDDFNEIDKILNTITSTEQSNK